MRLVSLSVLVVHVVFDYVPFLLSPFTLAQHLTLVRGPLRKGWGRRRKD